MPKNSSTVRRPRRWPLYLLVGLSALLGLILLLQLVWAHRAPPFVPDYPRVDLAPILAQSALVQGDYDVLFRQTGLARPAVDTLLGQGETGRAQIFAVQNQFWAEYRTECCPLFSFVTMEDRLKTASGAPAYGPSLPALEDGDVLLSFSTHSLGWRHGHAGVVLDAAEGTTLEAALIGTDSQLMNAGHWRAYSNYMVLRLRDMTQEQSRALADYCAGTLLGVPYHLTSGFLGSKAPDPEDAWFGVQCSYLVWYAFQHFGYDVDADGGPLVTVADLAASPLFEVVQVYGIDPRRLEVRG